MSQSGTLAIEMADEAVNGGTKSTCGASILRAMSSISTYCQLDRKVPVVLFTLLCYSVLIAVLVPSRAMKWDQAFVMATGIAAAFSWGNNVNGFSMELTSLSVIVVLTLSGVGEMDFAEVMIGATGDAVWLTWVGATVGAAMKELKLDDIIVLTITRRSSSFWELLCNCSLCCFISAMLIPSATARTVTFPPYGSCSPAPGHGPPQHPKHLPPPRPNASPSPPKATRADLVMRPSSRQVP